MTHWANDDAAFDAAYNAQISTVTREVSLGELPVILAKLTKLQNRAVKLGQERFGVWPAAGVTRTAYHCSEWFNPSNKTVLKNPPDPQGIWKVNWIEQFTEVVIEAVTVGLAGWNFVATLSYLTTEDGKKEVLISSVPGCEEDLPEEFRHTTPDRCDHCGVARYRTESFVVSNVETGEYKQVGRQCLAAFLGADPTKVIALTRLLGSMDEDGFWGAGGRAEAAWPLGPYLGCVAASIKKHGWISRGKARDSYGTTASADDARYLYEGDSYNKIPAYTPSEDEVALAQAALDWHAANWADLADPNDYQHNLSLALRLGCVVRKTMGLVASLISVYQRETEKTNRERVDAERRESAPSDYVGTIGVRMDIECGELLGTRMIESQWGCSVLLTFTDTAGNVLKWFCSGDETPLIDGLNAKARGEQARVVVSATVKSHEEWKGERQTQVGRVTVWTVAAIEAAEKKVARLAARSAKRGA